MALLLLTMMNELTSPAILCVEMILHLELFVASLYHDKWLARSSFGIFFHLAHDFLTVVWLLFRLAVIETHSGLPAD